MHYIGMAGLELCRAIYTTSGVIYSSFAGVGLCILAFWITYGQRTDRNIVLGTICFAIAVCSVHFFGSIGHEFCNHPKPSRIWANNKQRGLSASCNLFQFCNFRCIAFGVSVTYLVAPNGETKIGDPSKRNTGANRRRTNPLRTRW